MRNWKNQNDTLLGMQKLRLQIQNVMTSAEKRWIGIMKIFSKYWGCHQMPERSFFWHGYQFPVCARCTGMIIGYILATCIVPFFNFFTLRTLLLCLPMALDGGIQYLTNYKSTNPRRFLTGLLYGFGFLGSLITLIKYLCH